MPWMSLELTDIDKMWQQGAILGAGRLDKCNCGPVEKLGSDLLHNMDLEFPKNSWSFQTQMELGNRPASDL